MRQLLSALSLALLLCAPAASAAPADAEAARRLVELTLKEEVAPADPRVTQAQAQLNKAAKLAGEDVQAVAAASIRAARFLFDATKAPVTPLDVLDAVAARGKGRPLADTVGAYVEARRNSSGKTHAEAMAAMK